MTWTTPAIWTAAAATLLNTPSSATYISVADADTYFADSFNNAAWSALSAAEKDIALKEATRALETLCWKGDKCSTTQSLAWPRTIDATDCCAAVDCTTLPLKLVEATAELALKMHQDQAALIASKAAAVATGVVKRNKLGDLEQEFFAPADAKQGLRYGPSAPTVLQRYPWLGDLLGECYLATTYSGSRVISRCC